jgi:thioredoxin-related protein
LILICAGAAPGVGAQTPNPDGSYVKWMSIEEAVQKHKEFPKPILVDLYTDWCGWCKHMMKTTYAQEDLAAYINANFYPVKFNAEGKDSIMWRGKKYKPVSDAPRTTHPWAMEMLGGNLSYPTTIFLNAYDTKDSAFALNLVAPGYLDRPTIEPLLVFTLENVFRNSNFEDFNKEFKIAFNDSIMNLRKEKNNWIWAKDFFTPGKTTKKKSIVFISTSWCNSGRVMSKTTFSDATVFSYIDTTFNLIELNPESKDSLFYLGNSFINARTPQAPFHQLTYALTRNNITIPTIVFLDENMQILDVIPFYLPPAALNRIAHYFGDGYNKKMPWQEYIQKHP